ncbi:MAG: LLM class flavin-dependent oxidoreductase [Ktedonobacteraceae bacterium]|nr:LLM class flavin-dependent oxidoreductase [Ktedonobacteraceae bacterium]
MHFALHMPPFGDYSNPHLISELAHEIEESGWDGFFVWDVIMSGIGGNQPVADPWLILAVIATNTKRIKLGTIVTPLPRRRLQKLARETVTLDHLSNGRLIMGAGSGGDWWREYSAFGEATDRKRHGEMLDEGLEILTNLWSGELFSYKGKHYQADDVQFLPKPVQQPRIPIWMGGIWPRKKPFQRAARWDGIAPGMKDHAPTPDDYREMLTFIKAFRTSTTPFDVVHGIDTEHRVETTGEDAARDRALVAPYAEAGVTWWLEDISPMRGSLEVMRRRIHEGPPGM